MSAPRSVSQYKTYAACSERYRLEKVARAPQRPAAWLAQGTALHTAVEQWELSGRTIDAVAAFSAAYVDEIGKLKEVEPDLSRWMRQPRLKTETDVEQRLEKGRAQVSLYIRDARRSQAVVATLPDGSLALEVPFVISLGGVVVRGAIDKLEEWPDGQVTAVDYKTGNKLPGNIQLGLYAVAAELALGLTVSWGYYWHTVRVKDGAGGFRLESRSRGPIDLRRYTENHAYLAEQLQKLDDGIKRKIFLPNVGDHCGMCAVSDFCREVGDRWAEYLDGTETMV